MNTEQMYNDVVEKFAQHVNPYLAKLMRFAGLGVEAKGEGCYLYDHEDRKYLDCLGCYGVLSLGHRHPKVIEAVKKQLDIMPMSGKVFFSKPQAELATKLAEIAPGDLQYCFFSNGGAESVEAALKFAKGATGRKKIVSTLGGYHGKTLGALSVTGREKFRERFEPLLADVEFVEFGNTAQMEKAIDQNTAAMIVETIQGEAGIHVAPAGYLGSIRNACTKHGALMIVDEVQTGIGRTGKMFGCDHEGIQPDLMCLAKALGGGVMPIAVTLGTSKIWETIFKDNPTIHSNTFGGNPLACVAGLTTLSVIQEEGLIQQAAKVGALFKAGLEQVQIKHDDFLKEVRGKGLMIGVEFRMDDVAELAISQMIKRGMVAAYTLNNPHVIRIEPPLILKPSEAEWAVQVFDDAVADTKEMVAEVTKNS